jgi:hypothetical protein
MEEYEKNIFATKTQRKILTEGFTLGLGVLVSIHYGISRLSIAGSRIIGLTLQQQKFIIIFTQNNVTRINVTRINVISDNGDYHESIQIRSSSQRG